MKFNNILFLLIAVTVAAIFYNYRFIFFYKYEPEYYENWYYHSQWSYPQSARGISDGELYKFVGFRLAEGENPFNINFEAPPFGKYLYGLSEKFLGTPYPVTILLYLSSIGFLVLLLKNLFLDKKLVLASLILFVTTPFVATQIGETMLDLPLMTFYLMHVFFFLRYLLGRNLRELAFAGIFLGLATGTKFGIYTPGVLILGVFLLLSRISKTPKNFIPVIFYCGTAIAGYLLAFISYFLKHPNPIPWIRLHEKVFNFYLGSDKGSIDYLNQWKGIFLNSYQSWWQLDKKVTLGDWSLILPIGTITAFLIFIKSIQKKDQKWIYISGITLVFLITNTFIPFWSRYLMPTIPLFILLIVYLFRKKILIILLLVILNLPFLYSSLNSNNPKGDFEASARFMNIRAYRELYRSIDPSLRVNLKEDDFINTYETFLDKINIRKVEVSLGNITKIGDRATAEAKIKYDTKYGLLEHNSNFEFIKVRNQWKMRWNWDYVWPQFTPGDKVIVVEEVHTAMKDKWKAVYIMPRVMFDWRGFLNRLSGVTGEGGVEIDQRLTQVVPDKYPRFVGFLDRSLGEQGIKAALAIPGVTLRDNENTKASIFLEETNGKRILLSPNQ